MKTWLFPDGFVGDDPSSKRNASWLVAVFLTFLVSLLILSTLPGCALIAAGIVGATVEREHRDWCRFHRYESNCWEYYR